MASFQILGILAFTFIFFSINSSPFQKALADFLEKCGYDPISITKFEEDWNVDLNGDNIIGNGRRRRRRRDEDYDCK